MVANTRATTGKALLHTLLSGVIECDNQFFAYTLFRWNAHC